MSLSLQGMVIWVVEFSREDYKLKERPLMMSNFRGGWGFEMTAKTRILKGKNRTLWGDGWGKKLVKIVGHH